MNFRYCIFLFIILFSGCFIDGTVDTDYTAPMSNEEFQQTLIDVHDDAQTIEIGFNGADTATTVTLDIILPISGENGSEVSWWSSNETVISTSGVVTRQVGDVTVTMIGIATKHNISSSKSFSLTVLSL